MVSAQRSARETSASGDIMVVNGVSYRRCVVAKRTYRVRATHTGEPGGSLIDGGCNGGLAGADVLLFHTVPRHVVNVQGIAGTGFDDVPVGTVAAYIPTATGPIIGFFHQYAATGKGTTIHSPTQLCHFDNIVDDCPKSLGGSQLLQTHDGYSIPLSICDGLSYMDMRKPTETEIASYPMLTSPLMPLGTQLSLMMKFSLMPMSLHPQIFLMGRFWRILPNGMRRKLTSLRRRLSFLMLLH